MRNALFVRVIGVLVAGLFLTACSGGGSSPTSPSANPPVSTTPPATNRIVFMTIPVINIQPNGLGSYPAAPDGLSTGKVEVKVNSSESGAHAIYVFKLPKLNTPEYQAMYAEMQRCRSNSSRRDEACALAVAADLSQDREKIVKFDQTREEVQAGITYQTVIWNRETQSAVSVQGEYAFTPEAQLR